MNISRILSAKECNIAVMDDVAKNYWCELHIQILKIANVENTNYFYKIIYTPMYLGGYDKHSSHCAAYINLYPFLDISRDGNTLREPSVIYVEVSDDTSRLINAVIKRPIYNNVSDDCKSRLDALARLIEKKLDI